MNIIKAYCKSRMHNVTSLHKAARFSICIFIHLKLRINLYNNVCYTKLCQFAKITGPKDQ